MDVIGYLASALAGLPAILGIARGYVAAVLVVTGWILVALAIASLVALMLMPTWSTLAEAWQPADGIEQYAIVSDPWLPAQEAEEVESESAPKVPAAPASVPGRAGTQSR